MPKAILEKPDLKKLTENSNERNYYEVLSSVTSQPATSLKKNPLHGYFPMTFGKIFQKTVLWQNIGKGKEGTEAFA